MGELARDDFRARYGRCALVAGASDGIGEAFARALAMRGLDLLLVARREAPLAALAHELAETHGVEAHTLAMDLTSDDVGERVKTATRDLEVGLLVYNAGAVHGARKFLDNPVDHALGLIALNCRGPVLLAHQLGLAMRERRRGGIVLLSSIASLAGGARTAAYNATKSFDLILAEALWHELSPDGVDVLGLIVGATRTPSMLSSAAGFADYPGIMDPTDVVAEGLANLGKGPCWVAGEQNRRVVAGMWPVPRVALINGLSAATAQIYDVDHTAVEGADFHDEVL